MTDERWLAHLIVDTLLWAIDCSVVCAEKVAGYVAALSGAESELAYYQ